MTTKTTKNLTTTKTKTTSGSKLLVFALASLLPVSTALEAKDKKQKAAPESAVIAGTVFRTPGFALPGAQVTVAAEPEGGASAKFKKEKLISNTRGEFALRVPPVPMKYNVSVKMDGYGLQTKTVMIEGEQRKEITFELEPLKQ
jgi:hypothetical protein